MVNSDVVAAIHVAGVRCDPCGAMHCIAIYNFFNIRITVCHLNQILTCSKSVLLPFCTWCVWYKVQENFPVLFFRSSPKFFCTLSLLMSSSSAIIKSDRLQFCSNNCRTSFDFTIHPRGDHSWGCLEHRPALHENIHTSQKLCNALLLHLHRLYAPFQQFVLQFYQL